MLVQNNVLKFIDDQRFNSTGPYNFFYKGLHGTYIDADVRTAFIAGVDMKTIKTKRDVDLLWACYNKQYQENDNLALSQTHEIVKIEQGINQAQQPISILSFKQAVVDKEGHTTGIFAAVFDIEEMSSFELTQVLDWVHRSLSMEPRVKCHSLSNFQLKEQNLTRREKECAQLLCLGMSAREIALKLNLSKRTVESYLQSIKEKLRVTRKSELIMKLLNFK